MTPGERASAAPPGPTSALAELEEAVAMAEKLLPPEHPHLKEYRETLVKCKAALGK